MLYNIYYVFRLHGFRIIGISVSHTFMLWIFSCAGAMENWGLVTYRETALLFDEESSDLTDKQWVATVIAHELAHQWFGNLVTMQWWDDLWLNEGNSIA